MLNNKKIWVATLTLIVLLSPLTTKQDATAQNVNEPVIQWEKYYTEAYPDDAINFMVQSTDGGYVLLAPKNHYSGLSYEVARVILLKIDKTGNIEWERWFNGSTSYDFAYVGGLNEPTMKAMFLPAEKTMEVSTS